MQACRGHARTHMVLQTTWIDLKICQQRQTYLLEAQNRARASQRGPKARWTCQTHTRHLEWLKRACRRVRHGQNTPRQLDKVKFICYKAKIAPREATKTQQPRGCIAWMYTHAEHSSWCKNGYKSNGKHQQNLKWAEAPQLTYWCRGLVQRQTHECWGCHSPLLV